MKNNAMRWWILVCVGLITFMTDLDASIVNVALPVINRDLSITMSLSELLISTYLVTICVCLLPFGKLGDRIGKIKIFKIGMFVFTFGSLLCGISSSITFLLLSRCIQAVGAAMTMSTNNGIITETFPTSERGRALGWIGSFVALGMIAGPGIGGIVLNLLSWQFIFWINVPIGIAMIIMGAIVLPKKELTTKATFDFLGTLLVSVGIIGVFVYVYGGQQTGYSNYYLLLILGLSLISLISFVFVETKMTNPLVSLQIFKNANFSVGLVTAVIIFVTNNFYMVLTPFYLENARSLKPITAGYMMMILPMVQVIIAPISGRISDKFGALKITILGLTVILITQVSLAMVNLKTGFIIYALSIAGLGLGNAIFQSPNNSMIMGSVPTNQLGIAGSINSLARNIGMVTGNAAATSLLFIIMSHIENVRVNNFTGNNKGTYMSGQQIIYWIGGILVLLTVLLSIIRYFKESRRKIYEKNS